MCVWLCIKYDFDLVKSDFIVGQSGVKSDRRAKTENGGA